MITASPDVTPLRERPGNVPEPVSTKSLYARLSPLTRPGLEASQISSPLPQRGRGDPAKVPPSSRGKQRGVDNSLTRDVGDGWKFEKPPGRPGEGGVAEGNLWG